MKKKIYAYVQYVYTGALEARRRKYIPWNWSYRPPSMGPRNWTPWYKSTFNYSDYQDPPVSAFLPSHQCLGYRHAPPHIHLLTWVLRIQTYVLFPARQTLRWLSYLEVGLPFMNLMSEKILVVLTGACFYFRTQEAEASGFLWVWGQLGLQSELQNS